MRFVVTLADGTELRESDHFCWDDIPQDARIERVSIHDEAGECLHAKGFWRYVCGNEAVSVNGGAPRLEAKIVGGVRQGGTLASCWRVDIAHKTVRQFDQPVTEFAPHVFRDGARE
mgnify:CR=1 FL=1